MVGPRLNITDYLLGNCGGLRDHGIYGVDRLLLGLFDFFNSNLF